MKFSSHGIKLSRDLGFYCILFLSMLFTGCSDDRSESLETIETIDQSSYDQKRSEVTSKLKGVAEQKERLDPQSQSSPEQIFSVSPDGITLVGKALSRNTLISQLVEIEKAQLLGGPLIDQKLNIDIRSGSMGAVLGILLEDVDYQARFKRLGESRSTLQMLWVGDADLDSSASDVAGQSSDSEGLASPVEPADGSIDAGEEYIKALSSRFASGDNDEKASVIFEAELTEGGVAFLNHILQTEQDPEILIEVIRRLENGEEFGAKWALLQSLNHPNAMIQLEILESIEVWRDPTIKMYIEPLTGHYDAGVREKALELVDDLNTYAEIGIAADPYGVDKVIRPSTTPEQRALRDFKIKQRQNQAEERSQDSRRSGSG